MNSTKPSKQPRAVDDVIKGKITFRGDKFGDGCPVGSHVRRSNPRDGLSSNSQESTKIASLHRLLRRGRVFGPSPDPKWYPADVRKLQGRDENSEANPDEPLGLMFSCLCSDLSRQFEFIQQTWLNSTKHSAPFSESDPIASTRSANTDFTIPSKPLRRLISGIPNFIKVLGGGYFLLPGREALQEITRETNDDS